ncbi:MAG: zinc-dependent metalloprotease [Tidjanibacter sp.]|nr:zinc-dependent metalloprotease [Tidjanibacter sp.]
MKKPIYMLYLAAALLAAEPVATAFEAHSASAFEMAAPRVKGKKKKSDKNAKVEADTVKKLSAYQQIFDKKKDVKSVDGLMTLHRIEGNIIVEIPEEQFGRAMMFYSFTEQVSNPDYAYLGRRVGRELQVVFTRTDSLVNIRSFAPIAPNDNGNIQAALESSSIGSILFSFPIKTLSPDSTAVVFDATGLFLDDSERTTAMNSSGAMGFSQTKGDFNRSNSFIDDIVAYPDHIEVLSTKSYNFETSFMGVGGQKVPVSVVARTIIAPLPTEPMQPRRADRRIGTASLGTLAYTSIDGTKEENYAVRWRMEPSDAAAFERGEKVAPKEPIVFYVDTLFTPVWRDAIICGIEKWNKAFEKIGFKNAVRALPYPKDDTTFNASNYRFNCVKYNQTAGRDITSWTSVDRRSGEILAASIGVGRDAEYMSLQPDAMIRMGAYNSAVRGIRLPDKELSEAVTAHIMRAAGNCLGLLNNYAAAAAYSVEELRDAAFTTEHGFASSVMTPVTYNYLVQPDDYARGAKVVMSDLGPYDYYAIEWLYAPQGNLTPEEVDSRGRKLIDSRRGKAEYKFVSTPKSFNRTLDPRYAATALSLDPIKALELAQNNQEYVVKHAAEWINVPGVDEVYMFLLPDFIFLNIFGRTPIYCYLGGYYLQDPLDAEGEPTYTPIPMAEQKRVLKQILDSTVDMSWADNEALLRCAGINDNMSRMLQFNIVLTTFNRLRSLSVLLDAPLGQTAATQAELLSYAASLILPKVASGRRLTYGEMVQLRVMVSVLQSGVLLKPQYDDAGNVLAITDFCESNQLPSGLTFAQEGYWQADEQSLYDPNDGFKYVSYPATSGLYYQLLGDAKRAVDSGAKRCSNIEQQDELRLLSYQIGKVIEGE